MAETKHYPSIFEDEYLAIKRERLSRELGRVFFRMVWLGEDVETATKKVNKLNQRGII